MSAEKYRKENKETNIVKKRKKEQRRKVKCNYIKRSIYILKNKVQQGKNNNKTTENTSKNYRKPK